jgi:hypothetical protein
MGVRFKAGDRVVLRHPRADWPGKADAPQEGVVYVVESSVDDHRVEARGDGMIRLGGNCNGGAFFAWRFEPAHAGLDVGQALRDAAAIDRAGKGKRPYVPEKIAGTERAKAIDWFALNKQMANGD